MRKKVFLKICDYCNNSFTTWNGNPKRFCSTTCGYKNRTSTPDQLFIKNTTRNVNGCLDYNKSTYSNGYGRISIGNNKHKLAHRFAWEMHNGIIPDGLWVLHKCDRPICCEVSHLFLGTPSDNNADMMNKGRHNAKYGDEASNAKLTEQQVLKIKDDLKTNKTAAIIAKEYNVHPETIRSINRGQHWRHLPGVYVKSTPNMPKGSKQHFSKLNEDDVKDILFLLKKGINGNRLSKAYGVSRGTIYSIKNGYSWKHVTTNEANPKCNNPEHLFLGTNQDNVDDMIKKGIHRNSKTGKIK